MTWYRFWWDERNIEHIANHGVEPYEVEEVIDDDPFITKTSRDKYVPMDKQMAVDICWSYLRQSLNNACESLQHEI